MAVAVKTSPGARSAGPLASPAVISMIGVVYLLVCLFIVFKVLPDLWWRAWEALMGAQRFPFVGGSLLAVVALAVGVGLLIFGSRLLGPSPPVGVRSGVFVAFAGVVLVVFLARWASLWLEYWSYTSRAFSPETGAIIAAVVGVVLLLGWIRLFTWPGVQKFVLMVEHGGWFHATAYKSNQGQKVRRGTIFGILLLVGAGVYTLISHGTLRKGHPDLEVNIPFTGAMAIESFGDAEQFIRELPASAQDRVEVRLPGATTLKPKARITAKEYEDACLTILDESTFRAGEVAELKKAADDKPVVFLEKLNKLIYGKIEPILDPKNKIFKEEVVRRLQDVDQRTPWADLSELITAVKKEAARETEATGKASELGPEFLLPTAVLLVDRYAMREVNDKTNPEKYVKISFMGDAQFKESEIIGRDSRNRPIVSREDFDAAVEKLREENKKGLNLLLPERMDLEPAHGEVRFASITLLPSVQFTIPLLLLAGSLWLAWRIVNMPTFADFLIATEAEMNKVSWTTQKRLIQDTIVVLTTVVLMAVFLFGMDWTWKVVLSWKPIGVLHIPKDQADTEKKIEQKKW